MTSSKCVSTHLSSSSDESPPDDNDDDRSDLSRLKTRERVRRNVGGDDDGRGETLAKGPVGADLVPIMA